MRGLYFAAAAMMAGVSSVFALLAELEHRYALGPGSLGWIAGTAFLAALCVQLTLARYADRGYCMLLLRVGLGLSVVGLLWFAAATELWQFIIARAMLGASVGIVVPAARRAIVVTAGVDLGRRLGTFYAAYLSGFVFGPPLAGLLTTIADVRLPFVVLGLVVALSATSLRGLRVDEPLGEDEPQQPRSGVLRRLLRSRTMIAALLVVMAFRYSVGAFEPMWAVFFDDLGASTMLITISMTLFALPMLVVARWAGGVTDRNGARFVSMSAAAITAPAMMSYGVIGVIWIIILISILHGIMEALLNPGSQVAIAEAAPKRDTASAQGLAEAAGSLAAGVGAFAAAPSLAAWGAEWAWAAAGAVMALLLAISYVLDPPRRTRTTAAARSA
ncbi:MAG: MFS transporter [Cumulibacter sp.]